MKRRSFFQAVAGAFAALKGLKVVAGGPTYPDPLWWADYCEKYPIANVAYRYVHTARTLDSEATFRYRIVK